MLHAVRLGDGAWVGNLHAQVHSEERAQADLALSARTMGDWAGAVPFVLGGDTNVREPRGDLLAYAGGHGVDHILVRGFAPTGPPRVLGHDGLSDHAPVVANIRQGSAS